MEKSQNCVLLMKANSASSPKYNKVKKNPISI